MLEIHKEDVDIYDIILGQIGGRRLLEIVKEEVDNYFRRLRKYRSMGIQHRIILGQIMSVVDFCNSLPCWLRRLGG